MHIHGLHSLWVSPSVVAPALNPLPVDIALCELFWKQSYASPGELCLAKSYWMQELCLDRRNPLWAVRSRRVLPVEDPLTQR